MLTAVSSLFKGKRESPGVVYYEPGNKAAQRLTGYQEPKYEGQLHNIRIETAPEYIIQQNEASNVKPGPEQEPYTWYERMGLAPVHASRVRARQYYHPTTDFALYDYDEQSPEELQLNAHWMARILEFNTAVPLAITCFAGCIVMPLHTVYRFPVLIVSAVTGVGAEICRSYMAAAKERQDLDDFYFAKEIWYIKNVETYQLQLPRMPIGREHEYQKHAENMPKMAPHERALSKELEKALRF